MKVIAKYRTVEVTYPDGVIVKVNCKSIKDALVFSNQFTKIIPMRERAIKDKTYLNDLYGYLKRKGLIETALYASNTRLIKKAELIRKLSLGWGL